MNNPLLSVIIPVKNNTNTLEYTLKTVLAQDYSNLQIIVSNELKKDNRYVTTHRFVEIEQRKED